MEEEGLKDEEVMNMGKIILMVKYKWFYVISWGLCLELLGSLEPACGILTVFLGFFA